MLTVLDTSVLLGDHMHVVEGQLCMSVISLAEIQFGVLVAQTGSERARRLSRMTALMERFEAIPVTRVISSSYAELAAHTRSIGRKVESRKMDLMIAATAHALQARLATADLADVEHLSDLIEIVPIETRT